MIVLQKKVKLNRIEVIITMLEYNGIIMQDF